MSLGLKNLVSWQVTGGIYIGSCISMKKKSKTFQRSGIFHSLNKIFGMCGQIKASTLCRKTNLAWYIRSNQWVLSIKNLAEVSSFLNRVGCGVGARLWIFGLGHFSFAQKSMAIWKHKLMLFCGIGWFPWFCHIWVKMFFDHDLKV